MLLSRSCMSCLLTGSYQLISRDICRTEVVARVNRSANNALLISPRTNIYCCRFSSRVLTLRLFVSKNNKHAGCELMTKSRVRKLDISSVRSLLLVVPTILILQRQLLRERLLLRTRLVVATFLLRRQLQQGRKVKMTLYEIRNV